MDYADEVFRKLQEKGIEEAVVHQTDTETRQIRFSEGSKDLFNTWNESTVSVLAAIGKHVANIIIKNYGQIDSITDEIAEMCKKIPESPEFMGINPKSTAIKKRKMADFDPEKIRDYTDAMIAGSAEAGAKRSAGVVYRRFTRIHMKTNYNDQEYEQGGTELVIRSFGAESTGQESYHFGPDISEIPIKAEDIGRAAAETARAGSKPIQGEAGSFTVLMSPYAIGNLLSYVGGFLSSHSVRTGISCFADLLGKEVASEEVTLLDDPTDYTGEGARPVDDEGTPTRKNTLIENGVLKTFLHSYSTGKLESAESTGNAGIISPAPWQLKLASGEESYGDMLSGISDGLFINNTWYTRFQDYRNGVFSTVPRDGVFRIRNGKIAETWSGIRISDSIPNILKNVISVSRERKNAKWWLEIDPTIMPYVLVGNVNVTRSF